MKEGDYAQDAIDNSLIDFLDDSDPYGDCFGY